MPVNSDRFPLPVQGRSGWPWTSAPRLKPIGGPDFAGHELPRISIVTPSFNQGRYLEETIRSVIMQAYPNLEYIIIDGGSTDGTLDVIRRYEPWISYWESCSDRGQAHALNKGFQRATGTICAYINSDDYYEPGALGFVADIFRQTGFDFLFGRNQLSASSASKMRAVRNAIWPIPHPLIVGHPRYEVVQDAGFWALDEPVRFSEDYHFCLDLEFFLRSIRGRKTVMTSRVLSYFREHPESKTARLQQIGEWEHDRLVAWMERNRISALQQAEIVARFRVESIWRLVTFRAGDHRDVRFTYRHP